MQILNEFKISFLSNCVAALLRNSVERNESC